jgi:two-component system, NarL family, nitrate/nitrite response regulator NarL
VTRPRRIRIVIGDHHPLVLRGVVDLLKSAKGFEVVAKCTSGLDCIKAIRDFAPDVALIEMDLPGLHGLQIVAAAAAESMAARIVVFAVSAQDIEIVAAAAGGVYGIVLKDAEPSVLLHSLREAAAGRKSIPAELVEAAREKIRAAHSGTRQFEKVLTHREQTVLLLAAHGMSNKEIARRLHLAEGTVKVHLHNIFEKLGVTKRSALANIVNARPNHNP